jgi:small GTP-binding protein
MNNKYKVIIVGPSGVGKTSIIQRLVDNTFSDEGQSTVGVEFKSYELTVDSNSVRLNIWDTAGQERFRSVSKSYFRTAVGAVLVFAVNDQVSFRDLDSWMQDVQQLATPNAAIILVGNKTDLTETRQVTEEEARGYAARHNVDYVETSAKAATGIDDAFVRLVRKISERVVSGEIQGNFSAERQKIGVTTTPSRVKEVACQC